MTWRYLLSWLLACALTTAVTLVLAWWAGEQIRSASAEFFRNTPAGVFYVRFTRLGIAIPKCVRFGAGGVAPAGVVNTTDPTVANEVPNGLR